MRIPPASCQEVAEEGKAQKEVGSIRTAEHMVVDIQDMRDMVADTWAREQNHHEGTQVEAVQEGTGRALQEDMA